MKTVTSRQISNARALLNHKPKSINHTVTPDKKLPFNEWAKFINNEVLKNLYK